MNVLVTILIGVFHGINEGMDMHIPNVRLHPWFKHYHRLWVVEALFLLWLGYKLTIGWWILPALILGNRAIEMGYGVARYGMLFPFYENFLGIRPVTNKVTLGAIQFGLLALGILLWILV